MKTALFDDSFSEWTIADVHSHLPEFPDDRILICPSPGTATEADLLQARARTGFVCELVDGTLVKKPMAIYESMVAMALAHFLYLYLDKNNIGTLGGEGGLLRILPLQTRAPDVSFIRWERLPPREGRRPAIYAVAPDLAVEVLSEGNTKAEMDRKLKEYFKPGTQLVWHIDPETRTAKSFTAPTAWADIETDGALTGGEVLPGFELPLAKLFARVDGPA